MRFSPLVFLAIAATLASQAEAHAAAGSNLRDTWWTADDTCFVTDIVFRAGDRVDIFFQDGRDDSGYWTLSGSMLTISFDMHGDTLTARYNGYSLRAVHRWKEHPRASERQEECVFSELLAPTT
jgi:hypothetical protein